MQNTWLFSKKIVKNHPPWRLGASAWGSCGKSCRGLGGLAWGISFKAQNGVKPNGLPKQRKGIGK